MLSRTGLLAAVGVFSTSPIKKIWQKSPLDAYKEFLDFAGKEVAADVGYNSEMMSFLRQYAAIHRHTDNPPEPKTNSLQVHASTDTEDFHDLDGHHVVKCSKLTIRNAENALFQFEFDPNFFFRELGIDCLFEPTKKNRAIQIAYRKIVPSLFSSEPCLAGHMALHEYVIDASKFSDQACILFTANPGSRLRVVLENCKGKCIVSGLESATMSNIFQNQCDETSFKLDIEPTVKSRSPGP